MPVDAEWFVAQDTFNAELPDGGQMTVQRGSTWHKSEHVVKLDGGRGVLFAPQRSGDEEEAAPPKRSRSKRAAASADDAAGDGAGDEA